MAIETVIRQKTIKNNLKEKFSGMQTNKLFKYLLLIVIKKI
jgi:hypothetical protein